MKPVETIEDVEIEIRRALLILKAMPKEGPKALRAFWPDFKDNDDEDPIVDKIYIKPLPEEVDDMYMVFEQWMKIIDYQERVLVLKRLSGYGWKRLTYQFKISRSSLYRRYQVCLKRILDYVKEQQETSKISDVLPDEEILKRSDVFLKNDDWHGCQQKDKT